MLQYLDPYTKYENEMETSFLGSTLIGNYGGFGMVVSADTKALLRSKLDIAPKPQNPKHLKLF